VSKSSPSTSSTPKAQEVWLKLGCDRVTGASAAGAPVLGLAGAPPMLGPPRGRGARGRVARERSLHPLVQRLGARASELTRGAAPPHASQAPGGPGRWLRALGLSATGGAFSSRSADLCHTVVARHAV